MEKPFDESWFHASLDAVGDSVELPKEEAHHLRNVLRVRPGRAITVTNGRGRVFLCQTSDRYCAVEAKAVEILIDRPEPPRLHVALGLLKGRDTEDPVEGLAQLEIAAIHLVTTDHTTEFKGQDHTRLMERLNQKSIVALKQAKKAWLTAISEPQPIRTWRKENGGCLVLVHPGPDSREFPTQGSIHLLTGPEGGFSQLEVEWLMNEESALTLGLGQTRIRGTHAPLVAVGKLMGLFKI